MKACLTCGARAIDIDWRCLTCGYQPQSIDGFHAFAPELALENDGMSSDAHSGLDSVQDRSFWFRARNRLIAGLVGRYASDARQVLEVGCGTGYVTMALQDVLPAASIVATEIYANGLPYAAARLGHGVQLMQMDATRIPFVEEFDLVCAFDVVEHITDDEQAIAAMAKSLKPGGQLFLSVPQHQWLWSQVDAFSHHKRRYARRELAQKCQRAGLSIVTQTSFVTTLLPLMFAKRLAERKRSLVNPASEHTLPGSVDRLFAGMLDVERRLIMAGFPLPVGGSRFVLARKAA
ncbi:SAM-dependent methyltransferase [Bosea sp. OAE506]|uniref:class I SAM-dependent methyltransferase n=1 Tax=Bosea sp. OAE506 TaxID=2663870 RepID=UPI00178A6ED9